MDTAPTQDSLRFFVNAHSRPLVRPGSEVSIDSGYYSDTTTDKDRRSSTSSIPSRDHTLDLADPRRRTGAIYECEICPKRFTRAYNLRSHLRKHTDERPFVCAVCSKAFARQHDRKCHERLHGGMDKDAVERGGRQRVLEQPQNQHPVDLRYLREIPRGIEAAGVGAFTLSAPLPAQYPALSRIDWPPTPLEEDTEDDHLWTGSSRDSGHGSSQRLNLFACSLRSPLQTKADVGELESSWPHPSPPNPAELCQTEMHNIRAGNELAGERPRSPNPKLHSSTPPEDFGDSQASPAYQSHNTSTGNLVRSARTDVDAVAPSQWAMIFSDRDEIEKTYSARHTDNEQPSQLDEIKKCFDNPTRDNKATREVVARSNANCHDNGASSRPSTARPYLSEPAVERVYTSTRDSNSMIDDSGANLADTDCVPDLLSADQHAGTDRPGDNGSSPVADHQTEGVSVHNEDGKLSDEELWSPSPDESSPEPESESGYESTGERSILTRSQKDLISRLMDEICSSFFFQVSHGPRQRGRRAADSFSSDSTQTSLGTTDFHDNGSSVGRGKRPRKDDEDAEDEDGGKRKRRQSKESVSSDLPLAKVRYFACPFHKFDMSTYSDRNESPELALKYRSCGPPGRPTIGRVKEHLYRSHQTPIHCPRCWTVMKTEAELGEHVRASAQCSILPQPLRWIPREVVIKLKDRKKAFTGQTDEDTWRYIYGLLFPDSPHIPSPYYDDDDNVVGEEPFGSNSPTSHAIAAYEEYARAHLPRLVEEALETTVAEQTQPIEESLRRALAGIVRDCHTRLAQNFLQHRSSSNLGDVGIQIDTLPSFYIEPLNLTDETSFFDPNYAIADGEGPTGPQTDSGYASVHQSLTQPSRPDLLDDRNLRNELGSFYGPSNDGHDMYNGNEMMLEDCDWAAILGKDDNGDLGTNGVDPV